jgi:uncharacterized damage-inducible protein DinB
MQKAILSIAFCLTVSLSGYAQTPDQQGPKDLRGVLLEMLKTTHTRRDWFVPGNIAIEGLTSAQAKWSDGTGNHSVGQLTNHLVYWDSEQLAKFKGEKPAAFNGNNDETFNDFDAKKWADTVKQYDQVMTDWERAVETADNAKLVEWASTIEHVAAHNAYHIGQIIVVRKQQGNWDPSKGVK